MMLLLDQASRQALAGQIADRLNQIGVRVKCHSIGLRGRGREWTEPVQLSDHLTVTLSRIFWEYHEMRMRDAFLRDLDRPRDDDVRADFVAGLLAPFEGVVGIFGPLAYSADRLELSIWAMAQGLHDICMSQRPKD